MKFEEAIILLKQGKKVRRWNNEGVNLVLNKSTLELQVYNEGRIMDLSLTIEDVEATDWEEFKQEDDWNLFDKFRCEQSDACFKHEDVIKLKALILVDIGKQPRIIGNHYIEGILDKRFGF